MNREDAKSAQKNAKDFAIFAPLAVQQCRDG